MPTKKPNWKSRPLTVGTDWQPNSAKVSELCDDYEIDNEQELSEQAKDWHHSFITQQHLLKKPRSNAVRRHLNKISMQARALQKSLNEFAEIKAAKEMVNQNPEIIDFQENREALVSMRDLAADETYRYSILETGIDFRILAGDLDDIIDLANEHKKFEPKDKGGPTPINDVRILVRLVADYWKKSLDRGHPKSAREKFDLDEFSNFVEDIGRLIDADIEDRKFETVLNELISKKYIT